ncbi:tyrosine-type recombinase/integrase [Haloarcula argentinensis]|uniref:Tyrosine-type recombinase/integrase n=1 Tax=Haloarcula argentinensis TaxID=43776 RepID=A0A847UMU0_HALAR|nr:site-specific integrase [Haloarcula argentinensis]NLV13210.1 tyrosine-type recombinase/integrase [Haloarcula argentinensis]
MTHSDENKVDGIVLVTEDAQEYLNPRQEVTYREHRRELAEWMLALGKNPDKAEGYSHSTVKNRMNRLDLFYRFIWDRKGRYIQELTTEHADDWMRHLATEEMKESTKNHYQKAAKTLFKWKREARNKDVEWEPEISYSDPSTTYTPRDYLTKDDRRKMREAAMEYGSVPHYNSVTPSERERWKTYLSQRLQKPKEEVTMKDWQKANSFKYTSMIHVALDAGLRPIEIKRANTSWVDTQNGVLRIPREESSKNRENWIVALKEETSQILKRWLDERETREKYDGRDALWLTMYENRYNKDSFRDVFRKIAKEANLDLENRDLTPYSIRHSTATYVAEEEGLAVAAQQCRHKSKRTTEKYEHSSTSRQQDAVNNID